jgi:uncharacterized protein YbjQ (UPF0145 family)
MDDDSIAALDAMITTAFTLDGYTVDLREFTQRTRAHAYQRMAQHAAQLGADTVLGVRYDATWFIQRVMQGLTEVLCCGTAVVAKPAR